METMGFGIWSTLFSQFLLTFIILCAVGLGACAVGAGWSILRRAWRATCPWSAGAWAPPSGNRAQRARPARRARAISGCTAAAPPSLPSPRRVSRGVGSRPGALRPLPDPDHEGAASG